MAPQRPFLNVTEAYKKVFPARAKHTRLYLQQHYLRTHLMAQAPLVARLSIACVASASLRSLRLYRTAVEERLSGLHQTSMPARLGRSTRCWARFCDCLSKKRAPHRRLERFLISRPHAITNDGTTASCLKAAISIVVEAKAVRARSHVVRTRWIPRNRERRGFDRLAVLDRLSRMRTRWFTCPSVASVEVLLELRCRAN